MINAATAWYVPLVELDKPEGARLQRTEGKPASTDTLVQEGGSFTITLETFCINGHHDERSDNDLLVRSRIKYGSAPLTEAINFFGADIPAGQVQENLLSEYIFSQENYDGRDRVYLEIDITEVDRNLAGDSSLLSGLQTIKADFGAIFPTLLPFAAVAVNTLSKLTKLTARRDDNKIVFKNSLDFSLVGAEGEARLRCGAYILFNSPVEAVQYRLRGLKIEYFTPSEQGNPVKDDYVVIKVVPVLLNTGHDEDLLENQQLAVVLSHANQKQAGMADRLSQRKFLQSFIQDAQKMRDLDRFLNLKGVIDLNLPLNPNQQETFLRLAQKFKGVIAALKQ